MIGSGILFWFSRVHEFSFRHHMTAIKSLHERADDCSDIIQNLINKRYQVFRKTKLLFHGYLMNPFNGEIIIPQHSKWNVFQNLYVFSFPITLDLSPQIIPLQKGSVSEIKENIKLNYNNNSKYLSPYL